MTAYRNSIGYHTYINKRELNKLRKKGRLKLRLEHSETETCLGNLYLRKGQTTDTTIYRHNGYILLTMSKIGSQQLEEKGFFDSGVNGVEDISFNFHVVVTDFNQK